MSKVSNRLAFSDHICDIIRRELISGKFAHDEPIREQKLATRFGTSRGPVRDALLRLTQEGVLAYETNKGVRVNSPLSEEERDVVVGMRLQLEKFCMRKFILVVSPSDLDQISILLERLSSACKRAFFRSRGKRLGFFTGIGSLKLPPFGKHLARLKCAYDYEIYPLV